MFRRPRSFGWLNALLLCLLPATGCSTDDGATAEDSLGVSTCSTGSLSSCSCAGGQTLMRACLPAGYYGECPCPENTTPSGTSTVTPVQPEPVVPPQTPPPPPPAPPSPQTPPPTDGMAGTGAEQDEPTDEPADMLDSLRQLCVDTINDYRATLGLSPLARASAEQESCSGAGAENDGSQNMPHASAGSCPGLGAQNTCPNWVVGGRNATLEDALTKCLQAMWDEGEPPVSRPACIQDSSGCFLQHGHFMNMSDTDYGVVACGFYEVSPGEWWMNQDFGR